MAGKLGIYLGSDRATIVEAAGISVKNCLNVSFADIIENGYEAKSPSDFHIETQKGELIKSILKEKNIKAKSAFIGLSSKDLFIRSFHMPSLNKAEVETGVRFEAKKYIPFKTEDLTFDYQAQHKRKAPKMDILFTAIVNENLRRYVAIMDAAGLRIDSIEPESFALFRILPLVKEFNPKISCALLSISQTDADLSIFTEGFPSFSREIKVHYSSLDISLPNQPQREGAADPDMRLAGEIRVCLDYFRRQSEGRSVDKIFVLSKDIRPESIEKLNKELGLVISILDLNKSASLGTLKVLNEIKAYAIALKNSVKINLSINLAGRKLYGLAVVEHGKEKVTLVKPKTALSELKNLTQPALLSLGFMIVAYLMPSEDVVRTANRLKILEREAEESLKEFNVFETPKLLEKTAQIKEQIAAIGNMISQREYLIPTYNVFPVIVKRGSWIEELDISLEDGHKKFYMKGKVYLADKPAEEEMVNSLIQSFKKNAQFMSGMSGLSLKALERLEDNACEVTSFQISGE